MYSALGPLLPAVEVIVTFSSASAYEMWRHMDAVGTAFWTMPFALRSSWWLPFLACFALMLFTMSFVLSRMDNWADALGETLIGAPILRFLIGKLLVTLQGEVVAYIIASILSACVFDSALGWTRLLVLPEPGTGIVEDSLTTRVLGDGFWQVWLVRVVFFVFVTLVLALFAVLHHSAPQWSARLAEAHRNAVQVAVIVLGGAVIGALFWVFFSPASFFVTMFFFACSALLPHSFAQEMEEDRFHRHWTWRRIIGYLVLALGHGVSRTVIPLHLHGFSFGSAFVLVCTNFAALCGVLLSGIVSLVLPIVARQGIDAILAGLFGLQDIKNPVAWIADLRDENDEDHYLLHRFLGLAPTFSAQAMGCVVSARMGSAIGTLLVYDALKQDWNVSSSTRLFCEMLPLVVLGVIAFDCWKQVKRWYPYTVLFRLNPLKGLMNCSNVRTHGAHRMMRRTLRKIKGSLEAMQDLWRVLDEMRQGQRDLQRVAQGLQILGRLETSIGELRSIVKRKATSLLTVSFSCNIPPSQQEELSPDFRMGPVTCFLFGVTAANTEDCIAKVETMQLHRQFYWSHGQVVSVTEDGRSQQRLRVRLKVTLFLQPLLRAFSSAIGGAELVRSVEPTLNGLGLNSLIGMQGWLGERVYTGAYVRLDTEVPPVDNRGPPERLQYVLGEARNGTVEGRVRKRNHRRMRDMVIRQLNELQDIISNRCYECHKVWDPRNPPVLDRPLETKGGRHTWGVLSLYMGNASSTVASLVERPVEVHEGRQEEAAGNEREDDADTDDEGSVASDGGAASPLARPPARLSTACFHLLSAFLTTMDTPTATGDELAEVTYVQSFVLLRLQKIAASLVLSETKDHLHHVVLAVVQRTAEEWTGHSPAAQREPLQDFLRNLVSLDADDNIYRIVDIALGWVDQQDNEHADRLFEFLGALQLVATAGIAAMVLTASDPPGDGRDDGRAPAAEAASGDSRGDEQTPAAEAASGDGRGGERAQAAEAAIGDGREEEEQEQSLSSNEVMADARLRMRRRDAEEEEGTPL